MEKSELMDSDFDKDDTEEILVGSRDKMLATNPLYFHFFEHTDKTCFESNIRRIYEYVASNSRKKIKHLRYPKDGPTFSDKNKDAEQILEILREYQQILTPREIKSNERVYAERLEDLIVQVTRNHVSWIVPMDKVIDFAGDEHKYKSYFRRRSHRITVYTKKKVRLEEDIIKGVTRPNIDLAQM